MKSEVLNGSSPPRIAVCVWTGLFCLTARSTRSAFTLSEVTGRHLEAKPCAFEEAQTLAMGKCLDVSARG